MLSAAEFRQLCDLLPNAFSTIAHRRFLLHLAFPNDSTWRTAVPLEGASREFVVRLLQQYSHDRNALLAILQTVQDEVNSDLARALQPFVDRLTTGRVEMPKHKIFISYRHRSIWFARMVVENLRVRMPNAEFFADFFSGHGDIDFLKNIRSQLSQADCLLVMLDAETFAAARLTESWLYHEVRFALSHGLPIILVSDGAPFPSPDQLPSDIRSLAERTRCVMPQERWEESLEQLIELIAVAVANPPSPVKSGLSRN